MSDSPIPSKEGPGPEGLDPELEKIWPSILELQRFLAKRPGGFLKPGGIDELAVVSLTSCDSYSCK